jgi:hypothetical protein
LKALIFIRVRGVKTAVIIEKTVVNKLKQTKKAASHYFRIGGAF